MTVPRSELVEFLAVNCDADQGCCGVRGDDGECCMSGRVLDMLAALQAFGGPSLSQLEAICRGQLIVARVVETGTPAAEVVRLAPPAC